MTNDPHPFGYTVAMRQVFLTAAFIIGGGAALVTPSLFATSAFANAYIAAADALPTEFMAAQLNSSALRGGVSAGSEMPQQLPPRPMMQNTAGGVMSGDGENMVGRPNAPHPVSPAEIVKALVAAGLISPDKAQDAIEVVRKTIMAQGNPNEKKCIAFNRILRLGDRGEDVKKLNQLLQSEGFDVSGNPEEYTEQTSSAVTGLQEKYKDEILVPAGLKFGTGLVGKGTMMKLNTLRACGDAPTYNSSSTNGKMPSSAAGTPSQLSPEMLKKKMEMEQKYRELCAAGKCPDARPLPVQTSPRTTPVSPSGTAVPTDAGTQTTPIP